MFNPESTLAMVENGLAIIRDPNRSIEEKKRAAEIVRGLMDKVATEFNNCIVDKEIANA